MLKPHTSNTIIMSIKEELTKSQLAFLDKHKISEDLLLNANGSGMTEELSLRMSEEGKILAYNTSECSANKNHNFITPEGDCPQCHTASIQTALKEYQTGYIYIIGSVQAGLTKVGAATEIIKRVKSLNGAASRYGGFDDWEMLFYAKTSNIGKVERKVQEGLASYMDTRQFRKSEKMPKGSQLFRCSYNRVQKALTDVQEELAIEFTQKVEKSAILYNYQFRNLIVQAEVA
jgi:hypothetical protein